ncbi:MAG: hypothetical protein IT480_03705 [Gammaproteobacteria bacterium]|nr:hypothetical protein [Gammaproteobacteria bacterium]
MNYTAASIEKLRSDGRLQACIQAESGVVAALGLTSIVEHHGVPFGSVLVHLGRINGQCWIEPYQGEGGSVCLQIEGQAPEYLPLSDHESPQSALEQARQQLKAAMEALRVKLLQQARDRLQTLQGAAR